MSLGLSFLASLAGKKQHGSCWLCSPEGVGNIIKECACLRLVFQLSWVTTQVLCEMSGLQPSKRTCIYNLCWLLTVAERFTDVYKTLESESRLGHCILVSHHCTITSSFFGLCGVLNSSKFTGFHSVFLLFLFACRLPSCPKCSGTASLVQPLKPKSLKALQCLKLGISKLLAGSEFRTKILSYLI